LFKVYEITEETKRRHGNFITLMTDSRL